MSEKDQIKKGEKTIAKKKGKQRTIKKPNKKGEKTIKH
jgi:hypothetical protein